MRAVSHDVLNSAGVKARILLNACELIGAELTKMPAVELALTWIVEGASLEASGSFHPSEELRAPVRERAFVRTERPAPGGGTRANLAKGG